MWKLLSKITKNLIVAIPVMMLAGFIFGLVFHSEFLKSLIIPFTFLMVYPMMVNLNIKKVFEGGDLKAQVMTQAINFGIVPFLAYFAGVIFFREQPYMALGLLLAGLVPTSGMTISWTGFARGNLEAAVKMTVIGLTLGSLATPFYVQFLMGAEIEIDFFKVMQQIVIIVFIPMAAGFATRQGLIKRYGQKEFKQNIGPKFPALSTLGVVGIVFIAIALKAKSIAEAPGMILYILIPIVLIYGFNFLLSSILGRLFLKRGDAIAMVYGSVMRNLSIALAIAINAFGKEGASAALVVAIAYIVQVQSAAWYVKFTDKIFGAYVDPTATKKPSSVEAEPKTRGEALPGLEVQEQAQPEPEPEGNMVADIRKILFATDISKTAQFAATYACSIGNKFNAEVWVIHVVPDLLDVYSAGAGIDVAGHMDEDQHRTFNQTKIAEARRILEQRIRTSSEKMLKEIPFCPMSDGRIIIKSGNSVDEIAATADEDNFDLIIMGTHGHGKMEGMFLGSTALGVMKRSSVPVLVARPV